MLAEELKQYKITYRFIYHGTERKWAWFKWRDRPISFTFYNTFTVNARNLQRALKKARAMADTEVTKEKQKVANCGEGPGRIIDGIVIDSEGNKYYSEHVLVAIDSIDIELEQPTILVKKWKDASMQEALNGLSVEEFKSVYGECPEFENLK